MGIEIKEGMTYRTARGTTEGPMFRCMLKDGPTGGGWRSSGPLGVTQCDAGKFGQIWLDDGSVWCRTPAEHDHHLVSQVVDLKLEHGKFYMSAEGRIVGPMEDHSGDTFLCEGFTIPKAEGGYSSYSQVWNGDGTVFEPCPHEYGDFLLHEVPDPNKKTETVTLVLDASAIQGALAQAAEVVEETRAAHNSLRDAFNILHDEKEAAKGAIKSLKAQRDNAERLLNAARRDISDQRIANRQQTRENSELSDTVKKLRAANHSMHEGLKKYEIKISRLKQEKETILGNIKGMRHAMNDLERRLHNQMITITNQRQTIERKDHRAKNMHIVDMIGGTALIVGAMAFGAWLGWPL